MAWRYVAEINEVLENEVIGELITSKYVKTVEEAKEFASEIASQSDKRIWLGVHESGRGYCYAQHFGG